MSEFGLTPVPGQTIDIRTNNQQFDNPIIQDDTVSVYEKPQFSSPLTEEDIIKIDSFSFNEKIISRKFNYVRDYFEIRV